MKVKNSFPMVVKAGSVRVKIYQSTNAKEVTSYVLAFMMDGKRQLRTFADLGEATKEAKVTAEKLAAGDHDFLQLRSADRQMYLAARDNLKPTGVTLEAATAEYGQCWKILEGKTSILAAVKDYARRNPHQLPQLTVADAVTQMLQIKATEGATEVYLKLLRHHLLKLADTFRCQLKSVQAPELSNWLAALPVSERSKKNCRQCLGAFYKFSRQRGWLAKDHDVVSDLPNYGDGDGEILIYTPEEMARLLSTARPEMVPFLALGGFAGIRSAEIQRMDWSEVDLTTGFIKLAKGKTKTATRRIIPIPANLRAWLEPFVKPTGPVVEFANIAKQLGWLAGASGVSWKKNALRHSYISYRVAETQNVAQTALEAGNSPQMVFRNYRELVTPSEAVKWFAVSPARPANVVPMAPAMTQG